MSVFAERLKNLRSKKGQTQDEVGKAVGKSRESVSKYEIGEREPDLVAVALLAKYYNVSADYMLGITDDSEKPIGSMRKPFIPELYAYEIYLNDIYFIPYLEVAVKIKDNNLELEKIEKVIDNLVKQAKKQKHP